MNDNLIVKIYTFCIWVIVLTVSGFRLLNWFFTIVFFFFQIKIGLPINNYFIFLNVLEKKKCNYSLNIMIYKITPLSLPWGSRHDRKGYQGKVFKPYNMTPTKTRVCIKSSICFANSWFGQSKTKKVSLEGEYISQVNTRRSI